MMTVQQARMMDLVSEINTVCRAQGITYAMYGSTAGFAFKNPMFKTGCAEFHIMVKSSEMFPLKKALLKAYPKNRDVEDLTNNEWLPGCIMRYVDTSTTLIDGESPVCCFMPGTAVTIHPVFTDEIPEDLKLLLLGHNIRCNGDMGKIRDRSEYLKTALKYVQQGGILSGSQRNAKKLYKYISRCKDRDQGDYYQIINSEGELVNIRKPLMDRVQYVTFEGMELPLSQYAREYWKILYGEGWKKDFRKPYPSADRMMVIEDTSRGFGEYIKDWKKAGIDYRQMQKEKTDYYFWNREEYRLLEKDVSREYGYARYSMDRIDLYKACQRKLPQLKEAETGQDIQKIRELMDDYLQTTDSYFKKEMGFFINDELFHFARMVWSADGREDYADAVYELAPEAYKRMGLNIG